MGSPPAWLQTFLDRLAADDLSAATRRGYRYDLLHFIAWYTDLYDATPELARLTEHDLITWRQHMMQDGLRAASINRRLEAVRRLLSWAEANGTVARNVALHVKSVRIVRESRPLGLTTVQVHGLLRAAGESSHGLARRNYALIQLMLQTGLRVGEVSALRRRDIVLRERAGTVRVRNGKGLKEREVPLNATARRALRQLLERSYEIRRNPAKLFSRSAFAARSTHVVTLVSAGPPFGGLYLKPPSSGGLCEGVMTIPSAKPLLRFLLYTPTH
jgi:integrase/recombinase XerC